MKRFYEASENVDGEQKLKVEKELRMGYLNLSEMLFDQAKIDFVLALQYDSACADAYWGLLLCKHKLKTEDLLFDDAMTYKDVVFDKEFESAMRFASKEKKEIYNKIMERIYTINEGENY